MPPNLALMSPQQRMEFLKRPEAQVLMQSNFFQIKLSFLWNILISGYIY